MDVRKATICCLERDDNNHNNNNIIITVIPPPLRGAPRPSATCLFLAGRRRVPSAAAAAARTATKVLIDCAARSCAPEPAGIQHSTIHLGITRRKHVFRRAEEAARPSFRGRTQLDFQYPRRIRILAQPLTSVGTVIPACKRCREIGFETRSKWLACICAGSGEATCGAIGAQQQFYSHRQPRGRRCQNRERSARR